MAVVFVMAVTVPLNWLIAHFLLKPGALAWAGLPHVDLSFLIFISFIATIAALTQIVEMVMEQYMPNLHMSLGIFLPLIAVNCSILGASLFMNERAYNFSQSVVFGAASGVGFWLAIVVMAAVQQKLKYANLPFGLSGFAINMITTGLIAMAFMSFAGIKI